MKLFGEKRIEELFSDVESRIKSVVVARQNDALTKDTDALSEQIYEIIEIQALKLIFG